jgi:hypothetical protein
LRTLSSLKVFIVKTIGPKSLVRAIIKNPWSSVQDGLLLTSVMLVATLLALEYDLFSFAGQLTIPQRRITLAEAIFLTVLLALFIFALRHSPVTGRKARCRAPCCYEKSGA